MEDVKIVVGLAVEEEIVEEWEVCDMRANKWETITQCVRERDAGIKSTHHFKKGHD